MAYWKRLVEDLPRTLLCLLMITSIGMGVADPDMLQKGKIKHAAHALAHLVDKSMRAV